MFGAGVQSVRNENKQSPEDYNGGRTATEIINFAFEKARTINPNSEQITKLNKSF